jgi:ATP-dependent helicase/nuclease subunit A
MSRAAYTLDGQAVDEARFYAAACNPALPVVIEACAGAGKTWMLVSRIVRALLDGAQPQQILAITFTRKAAGEMRGRLDEWLQLWAQPGTGHDTRVQALLDRGVDAAQAQALAEPLAGLQRKLFEAGRAVEVRTFHAWFAQLASHAPIELLQRLALPSPFQLIEDTSVVHAELFSRFHAAVLADAALHADYRTLVQRHRRSHLRRWLETCLDRSAELLCADATGTLDDAVPSAASFFPECEGVAEPTMLLQQPRLRAQLAALARALAAKGGANATKAAEELAMALHVDDSRSAFELAWAALFTKEHTLRKFAKVAGLEEAGAQLEALARFDRQQQGHLDHARMVRLARVLLAEFAALKRRQGLVDMTDLERAALAMLGDATLAPWLQQRLDAQLRHVLIDEFQDTSPLQWQALHGWLASYAGAGGGAQTTPSVFIVGDPKQSIYRFRRAEPRVFDAAKAFVTEGLGGLVLACDHTRRNAPAIVALLNPVFEEAAAEAAWPGFRPHTTASTAPGQLQLLPEVLRDDNKPVKVLGEGWRPSLTQAKTDAVERLRVQEARHVAQTIAALVGQGRVKPGAVMVLARKRAVLAVVAQALAALGLPHAFPEGTVLTDAPESADLIALLEVLASPGDDLSLARALKSPIFGCDDDELLWLSACAQRQKLPWWPALLAADDLASTNLLRAQTLCRRWANAVTTLTPFELVEQIVHDSDLVARLLTRVPTPRRAAAVDAVHAVVAAAIDQRGGRFATLYGLVRELKRSTTKIDSSSAVDAVQLLTVHGAKGLEAPCVFVVDTDPEPRNADTATLLVDWPVQDSAPRALAFVAQESRPPPSLQALLDDEKRSREREELNALYVVLTRARERLFISRTQPHKAGTGRSWWARLAPQLRLNLAEQPADAETTVTKLPLELPAQSTVMVPRLPRVQRTSRPASPSAAPQDASTARLGQALHRWLEWASRAGVSRADWPALARAAAQSFGLALSDAQTLELSGAAVLTSPSCGRFFDPTQLLWAGNEVPLAWQGQVLRIDRLVQLRAAPATAPTTAWWVLDYKLHANPEQLPSHREQLATYVQAVQALVPGDVVQGAFITAGGALKTL